MEQVNIHGGKASLSKLVEREETGEAIVIARAGKSAAKFVPLSIVEGTRRLAPRIHD